MALRVRKAAYRAWPVTVKLAESNEQGEIVDIEHTFVAHWKPISEKQRRQLVAELDKKFPPIPGPASVTNSIWPCGHHAGTPPTPPLPSQSLPAFSCRRPSRKWRRWARPKPSKARSTKPTSC